VSPPHPVKEEARMHFDWTVNVSNILALVVMIAGGIGAFFGMRMLIALLQKDLENFKESMGTRMDGVEKKVDTLGQILVEQAVQNQQLLGMQKQIDELKRGEGFIFPIARGAYEIPPRSDR
jgi:hypothetical protein